MEEEDKRVPDADKGQPARGTQGAQAMDAVRPRVRRLGDCQGDTGAPGAGRRPQLLLGAASRGGAKRPLAADRSDAAQARDWSLRASDDVPRVKPTVRMPMRAGSWPAGRTNAVGATWPGACRG